ncbi:MAG TPA: ROK family protein [Terriglobales bacterium]|nr:ROK family protein [Terriglobales bacterium]
MPRTVFAADVGGTKIAAAVLTAEGKFLARQTEAVDLSSTTNTIEQICCLARELASKNEIAAAGVAVPGLVRRNGKVWAPNLPGGSEIPLAQLLRKRLRIPVIVESDRNAAVLGETWRGAARGKSDAVVLLVGTGIGVGILSGGALLRGAHELSGCAGWMAVSEADGDDVRRFGGLEAFASGPALVRAATNSIEAGFGGKLARLAAAELTPENIARLAREHDPFARQIFHRMGKLLGLAVANLISLLDPQIVIIGGEMAAAADLFFAGLQETALARCQPLAARQVQIKVSRLGNDAHLLGVARLALAAAKPKTRSSTPKLRRKSNQQVYAAYERSLKR